MTTTPTDQSERDRATARELAEMFAEYFDEGDDDEFIDNASKDILDDLTRARAEGVREGVERAIEAIEKCKLRPNSMLSGTGMAAVHDGALNDALRALADSPAPPAMEAGHADPA